MTSRDGTGAYTRRTAASSNPEHSNGTLDGAIAAAESAIQALKLAQDPAERTQLSSKVRTLLAEIEALKLGGSASNSANANSRPTATTGSQRLLKEPQSKRDLPKKEQILLLKSSFLHGFKFPPWTSTPEPKEFDLNDGEELFVDDKDLPLSDFQEGIFAGWKRPVDALPPPSWTGSVAQEPLDSTISPRKVNLVQDAATDCSVVASLSAAWARFERGHPWINEPTLYPCASDHLVPAVSPSGKYIARLNFNGSYRRVVIDNRLPTSSTSQIIHVVDMNNPASAWPALVEKAYLKVRGGYDFPGSNSGTDLWIILGWIPEQIFLQSGEFDSHRFWERISGAFGYGDVLITMGTGTMSSKAERELGLAGEHDYAVLDVKEVDGQRLFLVKNPWRDGTSWRSNTKHDSEGDASTRRPSVGESHDDTAARSPRDLMNADGQLTPGTFWMDLENVLQYFESIYLNWNPGLFTVRQDLHFAWDLSPNQDETPKPRGRCASLIRNPQYVVNATRDGIVWVLLCRHFQNAVPADATAEEIEDDRYGIELKGHISLQAFSSKSHRVLLPDKALEKGWYVDSPQVLLKLECEAGKPLTLVPGEDGLPATKQTFTLSAFANSPFTLAEASNPFLQTTTLSGSWTRETAGGNAHSPSYSTNPQFSIHLPHPTPLSLLLETANDSLNVHVKLVHSKGQRIHSIRNRDIVFDSKDYRRGCAVAESPSVDAGRYTIICSTFEADQLGSFTLSIQSNHQTQVAPLPREGAGRVRLDLGTVTFAPGQRTVVARLATSRLVKVYAVARLVVGRQRTTESHRCLIRLSIQAGTREPSEHVLAVSNEGEYSAGPGGIRTEDVDFGPSGGRMGEAWMVIERLSAGLEHCEDDVSVELFSDQPDGLTYGQWRARDD